MYKVTQPLTNIIHDIVRHINLFSAKLIFGRKKKAFLEIL